jgi:hypothetical protein
VLQRTALFLASEVLTIPIISLFLLVASLDNVLQERNHACTRALLAAGASVDARDNTGTVAAVCSL